MSIARRTIKQVVELLTADPGWLQREVNCLTGNESDTYEVIFKGGKRHECYQKNNGFLRNVQKDGRKSC